MSCNKCETKKCSCGKNSTPVMPPSECSTGNCVDQVICQEIIPIACIQYIGETKTCGEDEVYSEGDTIGEIEEKIVDYFCDRLSTIEGNFVESVTGDAVDNFDPQNPIVNIYIDKTYTELVSLITGGDLIKGAMYRITDFQTIYDQPDFNADGTPKAVVVTKTAPIEPIVVTATSESTISIDAYQPLYPFDKIKYDYTFDKTEIMSSLAKGRITERIDNFNNRTDYDHRNVLFLRYETIEDSGNFDSYKDTGFVPAELKTFQTDDDNFSRDNFISDTFQFKADSIFGVPFGLSNNVLGALSFGNFFGNRNINNTFQGECYENTFGSDCNKNKIKNDFGYNNIHSGFNSNDIATNFTNNVISNSFYSNIISDYMDSNDIKESFYNNTISASFQNNKIGNYFNNNTILESFLSNSIENYFRENDIGTEFNDNIIANDFQYNTITIYFKVNNVGFNFSSNLISSNKNNDLFGNNFIGDNFFGNSIGSDYGLFNEFARNIIGSGFSNNSTSEVTDCSFNREFVNSIISSATNPFINNYFKALIGGTDFTGATHVYEPYTCTIVSSATNVKLNYMEDTTFTTLAVDITD